jgi:hypothetical protein
MSGRPHIKITESVEDLREILKQQKRILAYNKVLEFRLSRSKSAIALRLGNSSQERQWSLATSYQAQP